MASTSGADVEASQKVTLTTRRKSGESGPFVLRSLLDNVPLSADGGQEDIKINCVDYYGEWARWTSPG